MARVKRGVTKHARHKKILKMAKGYRGRGSTCYKIALRYVEKSLQYAYRDRRNKKRDFRKLWIVRINAAARLNCLKYSELISGLKKANIDINRKLLAELAVNNTKAFAVVCDKARESL